jgi:hypothetical protein
MSLAAPRCFPRLSRCQPVAAYHRQERVTDLERRIESLPPVITWHNLVNVDEHRAPTEPQRQVVGESPRFARGVLTTVADEDSARLLRHRFPLR